MTIEKFPLYDWFFLYRKTSIFSSFPSSKNDNFPRSFKVGCMSRASSITSRCIGCVKFCQGVNCLVGPSWKWLAHGDHHPRYFQHFQTTKQLRFRCQVARADRKSTRFATRLSFRRLLSLARPAENDVINPQNIYHWGWYVFSALMVRYIILQYVILGGSLVHDY